MSIPDEFLERRRAQNRIAQRRFRQKKGSLRKAAERDIYIQSEKSSLDNVFDDSEEFLLSSNNMSLSLEDMLSTPLSGGHAGSDSFADTGGGFSELSELSDQTTVVHWRTMDPDDLTGFNPGRKTSGAHLSRVDGADGAGPAKSPLVDQWHTSLGLSPPSTNGTGRSFSTGTDSGQRSSPGWLSALHMAAQGGHTGIMRVLLQRNPDCNERDSDGLTPLMYAAECGHEEIVSLLLQHGARLGEVDGHRRSALHWAVHGRREALLRLLLKHMVNDTLCIDSQDDAGRTPLHTAVELGFEPGVTALLESGANLHSRARKP